MANGSRAPALAVSHQPFILDAWFKPRLTANIGFVVNKVQLGQVFLPVLQFSPVSIIPPMLHTHSSIYHPRCIMFFSQYFSFPLSVSFPHYSILNYASTSHAVFFFLPVLQFIPVGTIPPLLYTHSSIYHPRCIIFFPSVLQFSPVSIIPPLLHTHSSNYHPRCIMFFSQYFSFPLSVLFLHCSILIHPSTTHAI